jgi:hypothetical protein
MKKIYLLALTLSTAVFFGQQAPPFVEPFDYTAAATLQTQAGWALLNSGDDLLIASPSLTYSGLAASTGNKLKFDGAGIDAGKDFANVAANTVYYSLLLNVTDLTPTTSTTGGYFAGFVQGTGSSFGATLWVKKIDANTFNLGVNPRTTAANTVFASTAYNINQTYLVVVSYTFNAAAGDDAVKLWINPTIGGAEPTATASAINTGGTDLTGISRFLVRQGSATDTPFVELDELRIATTYNDATTTTTALSASKFNGIAGLNIYPNPISSNILNIETAVNGTKAVTIFDVLGKQVLNVTTDSTTVNISNLNAGVYIVKIVEDGKTATRKLVVR